MPEDKDGGQVFDVSKPGKAAPDATGRPVIVGHGNMLKQDPMVSPTAQSAAAEDKEDAPTVNQPDDADKTSLTHSAPALSVPDSDVQAAQIQTAHDDAKTDEAPIPSPPETTTPNEPPATSEGPASHMAHKPANTHDDKAKQAQTAYNDSVNKLISDKKYALPIRQKSSTHLMMIGFIVGLLGFVGILFLVWHLS